MSIIYSYPTSQPTLQDLLIGTDVADDNATKSFSVQSLVSLINASQGNGIITDVTISTSDVFLTAIKTSGIGDPAITYTIGLTATGTPSATTFLRGDNQWVIPTVSAGIGVTSNSNPITSDVSNFDFTGEGVSTSSDGNGNVTITIEGATNAVESLVQGTGIGLSASTGQIVVSNTGITGLVQGSGITISTTATGVSTISSTGQTSGTVTSVGAGAGLVETGTTSIDPILSLQYNTATSYITQPEILVPLAADFVPFHSVSGTKVGKVTFGDIQASTLALVNTSITAANADAITNTYDKSQQAAIPNNRTVGAVPATQIVTCSAAEYTDMANANELVDSFIYLTTASAAPQNTVNFTINSGTISYSGGCSVSTSTTVNNNSVLTVTGAVGSPYEVITTISPSGGCSFSGTNPQTLTGTIPAGSTAAVTQNLTGSVYVPAAAQGSNTLNVNTAISGGTVGVEYTVSPTSGSSTGNLGTAVPPYGVTATIPVPAQYELTAGSLTATQSASTYTSGGSIANASFPGTTIAIRSYDVTYAITLGSGLTSAPTGSWAILVTGGLFSGSAQNSAAPVSRQYDTTNSGYTFGATVVSVANSGYNVSGATWSGPTAGPVTAATNITGTLDATVSASTGTATLALNTSGIGGLNNYSTTEKYQINAGPILTYNGQLTSPGANQATFIADIVPDSGYFVFGENVNYDPDQTVTFSNNSTVTATLSGTIYKNRSSFNYGGGSSKCGNFPTSGGGILKTSGGSASYVENGDTLYTSTSGNTLLPNGNYTGNINNVTNPSSGGFTVSSGIASGVTSCP
jgi:hypothetical protein